VFIGCYKYKLFWLGIIHDWSKFLPSEYIACADFFYGNNEEKKRTKESYYHHDGEDLNFDMAWFYHQKRNKHHWQSWVIINDTGDVKCFPIPDRYRREMLGDWWGARRAQGQQRSVRDWYLEHKEEMKFHNETRRWIEGQLKLRNIFSE